MPKLAFTPLKWQRAPLRDKSLVLLLDGPAGTGKSHVAAHKLDYYLRRFPNATGLMVRKTRESMVNSTLLFFERVVLGEHGEAVHKRSHRRFEYPNGSVLAYGGMKDDGQREALRSIGLQGGVDIIWMEEAHLFSQADYEELLARLRGQAADWRQIILTTNPDSDQHWIYQNLIKGGAAKRYVARTAENTHIPRDYESQVLNRLTGVRRKRLKDGLWVGAEGAVYEEFRYETHVIEPFKIPADWRRFRSIDFGFVNPFVCQWWAMDGDGRLYLYREIYRTGRLVADHAAEIQHLSAGEHIEFTVADHDAEDRATLAAHGIPTLAAKKTVSPGIQAVQMRLREAGDGKPRLFFFEDTVTGADPVLLDRKRPTSTVGEISAYVWQRSMDGAMLREMPTKEDDHGMDAMRYLVMALETPRRVSGQKRNLFYG